MELCFRYLEIQLVKKRKKEHDERIKNHADHQITGGRGSTGWSFARERSQSTRFGGRERPTSPRPDPPPRLNRRPPPEAQIR